MKRIVIMAILLLVQLQGMAQEDAQLSQYLFNGIYVNPAYAGYKEGLNVHSFYRSQWSGINRAPVTMGIAVDVLANNRRVGLALQLANDRTGVLSRLSGYLNYSYRLSLNDDESANLAFGIGAGLMQLGLDGSLLEASDEGDEFIPTGMQSSILPDAKAGVFFSNERIYAGFSVDNLLARVSDSNLGGRILVGVPRTHYYFTAGTLLTISQGVQLKPSFMLKDDRSGPTSLDVNTFILLNERLWLGFSYRTTVSLYSKNYLQKDLQKSNSMAGLFEIYATNSLRIGYAYDYSFNKLNPYNSSHEISLGFYLKSRAVRQASPRYF